MIRFDEKLLETRLLEVIKNYYKFERPYLVLEQITFFTEDTLNEHDSDTSSYIFKVAGRYGDSSDLRTEKHFEFMINPEWNYNFIQGYFYKYIEE